MTVYLPASHQSLYEVSGAFEKLYAVDKVVADLNAAGILSVTIGTAAGATTNLWLDTNTSPAVPSTLKCYDVATTSWIQLTEPHFLRHIGGHIYTNASTAPANPIIGDEWFDPDVETLYKRVNDGATDIWLDISTPGGATTPTLTWSL